MIFNLVNLFFLFWTPMYSYMYLFQLKSTIMIDSALILPVQWDQIWSTFNYCNTFSFFYVISFRFIYYIFHYFSFILSLFCDALCKDLQNGEVSNYGKLSTTLAPNFFRVLDSVRWWMQQLELFKWIEVGGSHDFGTQCNRS